jgi:opacity protein-like surface antigen
MKKISLVAAVLFFAISAQAQLSVGGGLGFNEKVSSVGITAKGWFDLTDKIAITPNVSYFFGSGTIVGYNQNLLAVDVNGTYAFDIMDKLIVYPVAGLNFSSYKTGGSGLIFNDDIPGVSASAFGVNIGAGAQYQFTDSLSAYFEPKFVASNYSQIVVNVGVLFHL